MKMKIYQEKGAQVFAKYDGFTIKTDQEKDAGGEGEHPEPFDLFIASLGTCAGIYVLSFCQQRGIPTDGVKIIQRMHRDQFNGGIGNIELEIQVPPDFPEQYKDAVVRSAELCSVKKYIQNPPKFNVYTKVFGN